ncbi:MAG: lyase family protein [archaeon]
MIDELDILSRLDEDNLESLTFVFQNCISPDDTKYLVTTQELKDYLTPWAEWKTCAEIQRVLLETRVEFGKAPKEALEDLEQALGSISPLNMVFIERYITKHDQLAVIEEIGRFTKPETKALLHPGTTSFDILDTARSYLFMRAWNEVIRPETIKSVEKLCEITEMAWKEELLQVGRTHLKDTSPVPLAQTISSYAARIAERIKRCDLYFNDLRGKISGIVGTGAGIDMVIGDGKSFEFEKAVLKKLGLKPDYTSTQIVQKERLSDIGHGLTTLMHVLADFADDIRKMYSSAIKEVTSREHAERLGGSSADAMKNNPIDWENIGGTEPIVEGGMRALYSLIQSDFQRDLKGSKVARYQPQAMIVETYGAFERLNKSLNQLSFNKDRLEKNLEHVRDYPSEAMTAIFRGQGLVHPAYGDPHNTVKQLGKLALQREVPLIRVALDDDDLNAVLESLPKRQQEILQGKLELYTGSSKTRTNHNLRYARKVIGK